MTDKLTLDDPVLQQVIKDNDIQPVEKGHTPYKPGSRQKLPKPEHDYSSPAPAFTKTFSVQLTAQMEARLIREGASRNISAADYLQQLVEEKLSENIGKAPITAPSWAMGKKVTAPTNYFGREKE